MKKSGNNNLQIAVESNKYSGTIQIGEKICEYYKTNTKLKSGDISFTDIQKFPNFSGLLDNIGIEKLYITIDEKPIGLSESVNNSILDYLKMSVFSNSQKFKDFDCFAFVCNLAKVEQNNFLPSFTYKRFDTFRIKPGEFICLSENEDLPKEIKHWAMALEKGLYLSKFGKTGYGHECLVNITNLESMKKLYNCNFVYKAIPLKI